MHGKATLEYGSMVTQLVRRVTCYLRGRMNLVENLCKILHWYFICVVSIFYHTTQSYHHLGQRVQCNVRQDLFVADEPLACTMARHDQVVRASSSSLDEPFVVDAVVKAAFGSEPSLARAPDGKWLLYSIGNSSSSHKPRPDCSEGKFQLLI